MTWLPCRASAELSRVVSIIWPSPVRSRWKSAAQTPQATAIPVA